MLQICYLLQIQCKCPNKDFNLKLAFHRWDNSGAMGGISAVENNFTWLTNYWN